MSQRIIISPDENGNNPTVVADLSQNQNMLPVNLSYHESTTIQTHNAVSIGASGSSINTNWIDCLGYNDVAITQNIDSMGSNGWYSVLQWSNDGATSHGEETILVAATNTKRAASTQIKGRYLKVFIGNNDTVAHTVSSWAYLKA